MTAHKSLFVLQLVLGVVIAVYSLALMIRQLHGHPHHVLLLLAVAEFAAAILFLIPATMRLGGFALIAVFALAALIHVLHGEYYNLGSLAIYAASALAVVAGQRRL